MDETVDHISNNDPEPETEIENIYKSKYEDLLKKFQDLERQLKKQAKKECLTLNPNLTKKEINKESEEEEAVNDLDVIVDIMLN
jgi:F0F1-type ATP synthase membrane subunit b/b'